MTRVRLFIAIGTLAIAAAAAEHLRAIGAIDAPRLAWIATARQFGPVGYRDPAGGISPDGRWIAYSEGRSLHVRPIGGGPDVNLPPGDAQIRTIAWSPDGETILADGNAASAIWGVYNRVTGERRPWRADRATTNGQRQIAWSPDGRQVAAVRTGPNGNELFTASGSGADEVSTPIAARIASPAFAPRGGVACIATVSGRSRVTMPCGGPPLAAHPDANAYGPMAFSPDGALAYVSLANPSGTVDLWAIPTMGPAGARQLTFFDRDSYAPTVAGDGTVAFKVQSYRTHVAVVAAAGGSSRPIATFQSETPSFDPTGKWLGITYGSWRRVPDDANYPDIAQDAGIIAANPPQPATAPSAIVHDSVSEDQSLCWSPNGQWIMFHSHKDMSDDIWLRRAAGDPTARRISTLGRGAEVGWPRWSADGRWVLFDGNDRQSGRSINYVVGIDQTTGAVTSPVRPVAVTGIDADVFHAEWLDRGAAIVVVAKEGPGRHVIYTVPRDGGPARVLHRYQSEHDTPGIAVAPDGSAFAFVAPAADGFFQIFRAPIAGGQPQQVTRDQSNKTQPAWSPDGSTIAFTVWSYEAQFWRMEPPAR